MALPDSGPFNFEFSGKNKTKKFCLKYRVLAQYSAKHDKYAFEITILNALRNFNKIIFCCSN